MQLEPKAIQDSLQALEEARYLDAYALTKEFWDQGVLPPSLNLENLLAASNLARRLGGGALALSLWREAERREPDHPKIHGVRPILLCGEKNFISDMLHFERWEKELQGKDLGEILLQQAYLLSSFNDFERAEDKLRSSKESGVTSNEWERAAAYLELRRDRVPEALKHANEGLRLRPGCPGAASYLVEALCRMDRFDEACEILEKEIKKGSQSYDILQSFLTMNLEKIQRGSREHIEEEARRMLSHFRELERLAPLAGACTKKAFAQLRTEYCLLASEVEEALSLCSFHGNQSLAARAKSLETCKGQERILLPHKPLRQKNDTCLPASFVIASRVLGADFSHDEIVEKICFGGTQTTQLRDWLAPHGWTARPFIPDYEGFAELVRRGIPTVLLLMTLESSHAVCVVGVDEAQEALLIRDPATSNLWTLHRSQLGKFESPLGPFAILYLPSDSEELLQGIQLPEEKEAEAFLGFPDTLNREGPQGLQSLSQDLPQGSPMRAYLDAVTLLESAKVREGMRALSLLSRKHPCLAVDRLRLESAHIAGNHRYLMRALDRALSHPELLKPSNQVFRGSILLHKGSVLSVDPSQKHMARSYFQWALRCNPSSAPTLNALGRLDQREDQKERSIVCLRWAALLQIVHQGIVGDYVYALVQEGEREAALAFLRDRVQKFAAKPRGEECILDLVHAYEDAGKYQEALNTLREQLAKARDKKQLKVQAIPLLLKFGQQEEAEQILESLKEEGKDSSFHQASYRFHSILGNWTAAEESAGKWFEAFPRDLAALGSYLHSISSVKGWAASRDLLLEQVEIRKRDEAILRFTLERSLTIDLQSALEFAREGLGRWPHSQWWLRECCQHLLRTLEQSLDQGKRQVLEEELEAKIQKARRRDPNDVGAMNLAAQNAFRLNRIQEAKKLFIQSLERNPQQTFALRQILLLIPHLVKTETREIFDLFVDLLQNKIQDFSETPPLLDFLSSTFPKKDLLVAIESCLEKHPGNPSLLESWSNLLIESGGGETSWMEVVKTLHPVTEALPSETNLIWNLSEALFRLGKWEEALSALQKGILAQPLAPNLRYKQAAILGEVGKNEEAIQGFRFLIQRFPEYSSAFRSLILLLNELEKKSEVREVLDLAIKHHPDHAEFVRWQVHFLRGEGKQDQALSMVQDFAQRAKSTEAELLLAETLREQTPPAPLKEIDACFERAYKRNPQDWDLFNSYFNHLVFTGREKQGFALLEDHQKREGDQGGISLLKAQTLWDLDRQEEAFEVLCQLGRKKPQLQRTWEIFFSWADNENKGLQTKLREKLRDLLLERGPLSELSPFLEAERLDFLSQEKQNCEEEWEHLLKGFHMDPDVLEIRFDQLAREERWEDLLGLKPYLPPEIHPLLLGFSALPKLDLEDQRRACKDLFPLLTSSVPKPWLSFLSLSLEILGTKLGSQKKRLKAWIQTCTQQLMEQRPALEDHGYYFLGTLIKEYPDGIFPTRLCKKLFLAIPPGPGKWTYGNILLFLIDHEYPGLVLRRMQPYLDSCKEEAVCSFAILYSLLKKEKYPRALPWIEEGINRGHWNPPRVKLLLVWLVVWVKKDLDLRLEAAGKLADYGIQVLQPEASSMARMVEAKLWSLAKKADWEGFRTFYARFKTFLPPHDHKPFKDWRRPYLAHALGEFLQNPTRETAQEWNKKLRKKERRNRNIDQFKEEPIHFAWIACLKSFLGPKAARRAKRGRRGWK